MAEESKTGSEAEPKLANNKKEFDEVVKGIGDFDGLRKDVIKLFEDSGMWGIYKRTASKDRRFAVGGNKEAKIIKFMAVALPDGAKKEKFRDILEKYGLTMDVVIDKGFGGATNFSNIHDTWRSDHPEYYTESNSVEGTQGTQGTQGSINDDEFEPGQELLQYDSDSIGDIDDRFVKSKRGGGGTAPFSSGSGSEEASEEMNQEQRAAAAILQSAVAAAPPAAPPAAAATLQSAVAAPARAPAAPPPGDGVMAAAASLANSVHNIHFPRVAPPVNPAQQMLLLLPNRMLLLLLHRMLLLPNYQIQGTTLVHRHRLSE